MKFFKKETNWKIFSCWICVAAIILAFGPYVFEEMFSAVIDSVSDTAKYYATAALVLINGVAIYFGKSFGWKHAGFISTIIIVFVCMAEPLKVGCEMWKGSVWMRGIAVGVAVICISLNFILNLIDIKKGAK